jgi:hypothetical protein
MGLAMTSTKEEMMPRPKDPRLPNLADNIQQELDKRGWSASDLARRIWGEVTTRNGKKAARNRAIISAILLKRSWPNSRTLKVIADALGMTVAELTGHPAATAATRPARVKRGGPEVSLVTLTALDDRRALLHVNKILPMDVAVKILALISGSGAPPEILDSPERT